MSPISTVSIWSEKINGKGEDGPPLILLSDDYSFGVIAVSDGVGGAGSRQIQLDGELASGARLAARKLLEIVFNFFKGAWKGADAHSTSVQLKPYQPAKVGNCSAYLLSGAVCGPSVMEHIELLSGVIDKAFEKMNNGLIEEQSTSRLRTKMQRNLPSTLAGWVYRTAPEREITAFWSGDSRCYVLYNDGLHQISRDDAKGNFDAFDAIRADPPLTNYISETIPNNIKHKRLSPDGRSLLICASDGAFNYHPTPMHFEFAVLSSLMSSDNMQIWADMLSERLQASTGDDVSIVLHPLGFDSFNDLKEFYKGRLDELTTKFVEPVDVLRDKQVQLEKELACLRATVKEKTKEAWDQYRVQYEQYLHEGDLE